MDLRCNDTTQIFQDDQGFYRLQIKDVKPEDSGLYSCVARNDNGMSKSIANLRVRGRLSERMDSLSNHLEMMMTLTEFAFL